MTANGLVSSIIIFLNAERFITEAIESIFAQTYDHWELILVDDGSTDNSPEIARRYGAQYPQKVRYLEHPGHQNRGMSASRNLGIAHARGDYIGFLDADDLWLPHKLEQQVALLDAYPEVAMVYGRTQIWHSWMGKPEDEDYFYDLGVQPNSLVNPPTLLLILLQNKHQTPTTCNALMRRELFDRISQFEESFRTMYEDQAFFAKVLLKAPVFVANETWARYRQHQNSCSSKAETQQYYVTRLPFLNWLGNYLSEQNVQDQKVWKALQWELWQCHHPRISSLVNQLQYRLSQIRNILNK